MRITFPYYYGNRYVCYKDFLNKRQTFSNPAPLSTRFQKSVNKAVTNRKL